MEQHEIGEIKKHITDFLTQEKARKCLQATTFSSVQGKHRKCVSTIFISFGIGAFLLSTTGGDLYNGSKLLEWLCTAGGLSSLLLTIFKVGETLMLEEDIRNMEQLMENDRPLNDVDLEEVRTLTEKDEVLRAVTSVMTNLTETESFLSRQEWWGCKSIASMISKKRDNSNLVKEFKEQGRRYLSTIEEKGKDFLKLK